ncbi:MAG: alkene reductase, partial [Rhodospirillales bacterium]|nr:alkene reductase [Rhodospirillales bacterium]
LIAEATPVSWQGHGHPNVPGIHTAGQVAGWKLVTDAVHAKGGVIYLQLWHTGRVSHSSNQKNGGQPVGPSAIAASGMTIGADWKPVPYEVPRALTPDEMPGLVDSFRLAAANAIAAGFDGVEIHGANGYLLEQFLQAHSNRRTDRYGGSIENFCRLHLEISEAVVGEVGADRTGIRLSPWGIANDSFEAEPVPLYSHLIRELARLDLVYLHLIEPRASGTGKADIFRADQPSAAATFRPLWPNVLIDAGGFDRDGALDAVRTGRADAVAFGRYFISNPDLPRRIETGAPLTPYHRPTFYGGGAEGYTDYPTLEQQAAAAN